MPEQNNSKKGMIFDIQRFSLGDGPGIRTTVFLKGCPLRCLWCHNPESQSLETEEFYDPAKCISCGHCKDGCPSGARRKAGELMSVEEVMDEVVKDIHFYADGGGMTLSGGEPLFQPEFSIELLKSAKAKGIHTVVESSLFGRENDIKEMDKYTDLWLADLKASKADHISLIGVPREKTELNLKLPKNIILRIPAMRLNMTPEFIDEFIALAKDNPPVQSIELLPGHELGESKRKQLGLSPSEHRWQPPEELAEMCEKLQSKLKIPVKIQS